MDVVARTGDYRGGMGNATGSSGRGQVGWGSGAWARGRSDVIRRPEGVVGSGEVGCDWGAREGGRQWGLGCSSIRQVDYSKGARKD